MKYSKNAKNNAHFSNYASEIFGGDLPYFLNCEDSEFEEINDEAPHCLNEDESLKIIDKSSTETKESLTIKEIDIKDDESLQFVNEELIEPLTIERLQEKFAKHVFSLSEKLDKVKVIFIVDDLDREREHLFFSDNAALLFGKMSSAMGLSKEDFITISMKSGEEDLSRDCLELVISIKPIIVLTFGASTISTFFGSRQKLSEIHGQLNSFMIQSSSHYTFQVMALFHPELLLINSNMKKSAWLDMQKAMKLLEL